MRIKKAFEQNDLSIPFPVRTLGLGLPGGKPLAEVFARSVAD